jgi:hypothetical protein
MTSVYDSERLAPGAGVSTAALAPLARQVTGLEPIPAMLVHRRAVAPHAGFVICAGLPSALTEIARVLTRDGRFLPYDFSVGRRSVSGDKLAGWFALFEQRFPQLPGGWQPLDVHELPLAEHGLRLLRFVPQ